MTLKQYHRAIYLHDIIPRQSIPLNWKDMAFRIHWIYFVCVIYLSSACQESWKLMDANNQKFEGTVAFKNVTTPGKHQTLVWFWTGINSESWENKITHRYVNDVTEGSLIYRNISHGVKNNIHILWKLSGDDFSSVNSNRKIFNNIWKIYTIDGMNMAFTSDKFGNWEFSILDKYKIKNKEDYFNDPEETPTLIERRKRSEETEFSDYPETNITVQQAGVMDCVYDFLFGEGDPMTGQGAGVFTKVKNWVKDIACRFRGDCGGEDTVPSMIPAVTMPPYNPDAEEVPSKADNDVF